jgi:AcrR family transcriptional regulator
MPKIVDHALQRRELSASVVSVVAAQGLEHTTLRTVAQRHGCTKGMVQHYFADKEELLLAALNLLESTCQQRMVDAGEGSSGWERVQAEVESWLPLRADRIEEWSVRLAFYHRATIAPEMRRALLPYLQQRQKRGMASLKAAGKQRKLSTGVTPLSAWRQLSTLVDGIGAQVVADASQLSPATQRKMLRSALDDLHR